MKRIYYYSIFFILMLLSGQRVIAQQWLWGRDAASTTLKSNNLGVSVATDNSGNVWHIGTFYNSLFFGNDTLTSPYGDAFLVKYDNNGNLLWARQSMHSSGIEECFGQSVATDDSGNAYITGFYEGDVIFGSFTLTSPFPPYFPYVFVTKYDKNGDVIWARQSTGSGEVSSIGQSIACDGKGYEYVTGNFYCYSGSVFFGSDAITSTDPAVFLAKYDYNGNVIWVKQTTGTADSTYASSVAVSRTGDEYITGYFNGAPSFGAYSLDAPYDDIFLTKYDPNGNVLWAQQSTTSTNSIDVGMSVATDIYDNAYVTGYFADTMKFGSKSLTCPVPSNIFYAKFAPNGNLKWLKQPAPLSYIYWYGYSVSTDSYNHFYLSAGSPDTGRIFFSPDTIPITSVAGNDYYLGESVLVKFDSSGAALCGNEDPDVNQIFTPPENAEASDSSGNYIYLGGDFADQDLILEDTLTNYTGNGTPFTARWETCSDLAILINSTPITPCEYTCNGTATVTPINGVPPFTYQWSTGQTTQSISGLCAGTYSVTVTDSAANKLILTTIVTGPTTSIKITHTFDSICSGGSVNLIASGIKTYNWSPSTGLSCTTCPSPTATATTTTTYFVTGQDTNNSGCLDTARVTVTVLPKPGVAITQKISSCSGEILLTATGAATYDWLPTASLSCPSCAITYATPTVTTTYTVIGSNGACTDTTTITVTPISATSLNLLVTASHDTICLGDTTKLAGTGIDVSSWIWTPSTGLSCTTCPNPEASPPVTTTYTLYGYNSAGCDSNVSITIAVKPRPVADDSSYNPICSGDSVTLTAKGGGTYHWSTGSHDSIIVVTPTVTTTYSVTIKNSTGCSSVSTANVNVDVPTIFACCDSTIVIGNSAVLYADSSNKYKWYPSAGITCDSCPEIIVNPTVTTTYTVIGRNKEGCEVARIITIVVEASCANYFVPNVFTPNGDGINDEFEIKAENATAYSIIIYDRWGKEMYKSTNPLISWNGNTEEGAPSVDGVYYYIIKSKCNDTDFSKDGFVQLIR